jgi:hypothetical protein
MKMRKSSLSLITKAALSSKAKTAVMGIRHPASKTSKHSRQRSKTQKIEDLDETTSEQDQQEISNKVVIHLNAEGRARTQRVFDLCSRLGHPVDESLKKSLNNGVYAECDLTG